MANRWRQDWTLEDLAADQAFSNLYGAGAAGISGATNLNDLADVNASDPSDGQRLAWDADTSKWEPRQSTSALGIVTFPYRFSTDTGAPANTGDVELNQGAFQATSTEIFINAVTGDGDDITLFIEALEAGSWINLYDRGDFSQHVSFDVIGPPVLANGTYTIPVVNFDQEGAVLSNNQFLSVLFRYVNATSVPAADVVVTDVGDFYTSANVEGALQEIGVRVPAGGTTGQVLTKISDDDYDVGWA